MSDLAVVIFSKDRPLQLDATLRSLRLNCADLDPATIHVLYTTSSPAFAAQYRVLANQHAEIVFVREALFKQDLLDLVGGSSHLVFLVDDTLLVGPVSIGRAVDLLRKNAECLGFSFRLGRNTTYCYALDQPQRLPAFEDVKPAVLTFDWTDAEHDFGYPLEVSSSLYRTADLLALLRILEYQNPNTLESALAEVANSFRETHPRLACYVQSVAFSVPANLVQTAWKNRVDSNPALTAEALAELYARGLRFEVERYQGFVPTAVHEELDFVYTRCPDVPTVSVVTRCYAQARYLPDAVASVVGQTFGDWELIIVDDGSPDDTADVAQQLIERLPGHRIRLVRGPNRGLSGALNFGVEAALGRYILPLDADDAIDRTMLESAVGLLEREPAVAIAYTDLQQFGEGHDLVRTAVLNQATLPDANQLSYCSLYRREVWEAVGGYNPNMKWGYEDWDFWLGAVEKGYRARRIAEPLFLYRVRADGMYSRARQHDSELRRQLALNHPNVYRRSARLKRRSGRAFRAAAAWVERGVGRILPGRAQETR